MAVNRMKSQRTVKRNKDKSRYTRQRPIKRGTSFATVPGATGATAGAPGTWTPSGSKPPATVATATGIKATPTTPWTTGQYVQGSTAGAPGEMTWTGSGWVGGRAP